MLLALLLADLLVFHGNVAMVEDVYRSVLELPPGMKATPDNAHSVATRLRRFLRRAGYSLATVRARAEASHIVVDVDEGRLDKTIFLGRGATYNTGRLIFTEDRLRLGARIAGALRDRLDNSGTRFVFTRATGDVAYFAPPIWPWLRPAIRGRADLSSRQRPDLQLESFEFATLEGGVDVVFQPHAAIRSRVGGGVERRMLYGLQGVGSAPPPPSLPASVAQNRPYAEASLELTFDPRALRRDQHHFLGLQARAYGKPDANSRGALHLSGRYQKIVHLGWHELWIESTGFSRTGAILFPEEASVGGGDELRGPFGSDYARRLGAFDLELRFSLLRDIFKLGIFHNAVGYGMIDRATGKETAKLADAMGLGVHALIIDEFQLDAWFGVGFASGGRFGSGAALRIVQAY